VVADSTHTFSGRRPEARAVDANRSGPATRGDERPPIQSLRAAMKTSDPVSASESGVIARLK
jgi:hypothetical protein